MRFVLLSTTDLASGRSTDFQRLIASLADYDGAVLDMRLYVLLQNATEADANSVQRDLPAFCRVMWVPSRLSLSDARNKMLTKVMATEPCDENTVVGFPDDDCWLPSPFLLRLADTFAAEADLDLFLCQVSLDPEAAELDRSAVRQPMAHEVVRVASSNNMFLRGSLVREIGAFDSRLGLGTPAGGGEDTDYVIRAFLRARRSAIILRPLVGHRSSDLQSVGKYYKGSLVVLARYASLHSGLMREYLRKFLVGAYLVSRRRLTPKAFAAAAAEGLRVFHATRGHPAALSTPLEADGIRALS